MNDRIKQLAEQAGEYVNSVYTPPVRSKTAGKIWEDGHIGWMELFNAKFAEMIAIECADLCDRFQARNVGMQPAECAAGIRRMFGVE